MWASLSRVSPRMRTACFEPQILTNKGNELMTREENLKEILSQDPTNAFARYGLAMEYAKSGQTDQALQEFGRLLSANPDYAAGYFMAAQTLAKADRVEEAKEMLRNGIQAAARKGDSHAQSEMQGMLEDISE